MSEVLSNQDYIATAEALEQSSVACFGREQLVGILRRHSIAGARVSEFLSSECLDAFGNLCLLRQTSFTSVKLSRFLLRWVEEHPQPCGQWIPIPYTNSEIAQMVGASRETVSRLLSRLQKRRVIEIKRGKLRVLDMTALRGTANESEQMGRSALPEHVPVDGSWALRRTFCLPRS